MEHGCNIHLLNNDGNNALWLACFGNDIQIVTLLLEQGIEVNTQNVNGVTPLMYVASSGKESLVRLLLTYGADSTIKNDDDFSALDLASTAKILKMLRQAIALK